MYNASHTDAIVYRQVIKGFTMKTVFARFVDGGGGSFGREFIASVNVETAIAEEDIFTLLDSLTEQSCVVVPVNLVDFWFFPEGQDTPIKFEVVQRFSIEF